MSFLKEKDLVRLSINNMRQKYQALFRNALKFENMEYGVHSYFMDKLLFNGQIAAFNLELSASVEHKELAFATFVEKSWKWNNQPASITVLNERAAPHFPTRALVVDEEAVVLKLDFVPNDYIKEYVQRLWDIQATINTNLKVHKMPFIIKSSDTKTINAIREIIKNHWVVSIDDLTFEIMETAAPYIIDKLQLYYSETEAELLTILGVDNVKFEKKAQMTRDEVNANNEEITAYRKILESKIEAFFNQINEVLGHDLRIKEEVQDEIVDEESEGDEYDGF